MPRDFALGAALTFAQKELGGPLVERESVVTAGTSVGTLINGNGDRVALIVLNLSANSLYMALDSAVSSARGIFLPANGGAIAMNVRDDFTLPTRQWFCVASANGSSIYVLEMSRFALGDKDGK